MCSSDNPELSPLHMSVNNCKSTTSSDLRVDTDFQQGGKSAESCEPFQQSTKPGGGLGDPRHDLQGELRVSPSCKGTKDEEEHHRGVKVAEGSAPSLTCSCVCDCSGPPLGSLSSLWFWPAPLSFTLHPSCWYWPDCLPPGSQLGTPVQPRGREAR